MADKYFNEVGVATVRDWVKLKFAEKTEIPTKTSDLTNDGDGTSDFATEAYVDQNGGKIDSISVNNVPQTIDQNKNVNITATTIPDVEGTLAVGMTSSWGSSGVANFANNHTALVNIDACIPSAVSDFTNDAGYQTASDVSSAITTALANDSDPYQTESDVDGKISTAITSVYRYKGSVATYNDLPSSGQTAGDVYDVQDTGVNYAWTGTAWDALGGYVDTSTLWSSVAGQSNSLIAMTTAEINAILNA